MTAAKTTYIIVSQRGDNEEELIEVTGSSAVFDAASQRLTIMDGDEPVGGFIRILRWYKKP